MSIFFVFQLIFDNYSGAGPSIASPATSHSVRVYVDVSLDVSSCPGPIQQELTEFRQQLQSMKKQTKLSLEQSRKSSDREQAALRQAKEFFELKEVATADAAAASRCENYMLNLMTDASQDMAGTYFTLWYLLFMTLLNSLSCCYFICILPARRVC
jgi:hypothetical protein